MNKIKDITIRTMNIFFSVFFIVILVNSIFLNKTIGIDFNPLIIITGIFLFYLVLILIYRKIKRKFFYKEIERKKIFCIFFIIFILIIQGLILFWGCASYDWDCGIVVTNARDMAKDGSVLSPLYFAIYPNNIAVVIIFKYILTFSKFFINITNQSSFIILTIFNVIITDIAAYLTFTVEKHILGSKKACFSLLFMLPLIIFSPYILLPYTDTITMLFPILILYIYITIKNNKKEKIKKIFLTILLGFLTSIGFLLKPTVLIVMIAIIIMEILNLKVEKVNYKIIKNCIVIFLLFSIGFGTGYGIYNYEKYKNFNDYISEKDYYNNSMPFTHFIMMGMQEDNISENGKRTYGKFNGQDALNTIVIQGQKEKERFNLNIIKKRLNEFGFVGYMNFLYNKVNWILSDGTFFYGNEGNWIKDDYYNTSKEARIFQKYINTGTFEYNNITANIMQIVWTLIIIGLIFKTESKNEINVAKLAIIGLIMFILIFEGRSRYLINYLPIFILVGTDGISNSLKLINNFIDRNLLYRNRMIGNGK